MTLFIHRLIKRIKEEPNEEIQIEKLYNMCQFESIEYFCANIHAVYEKNYKSLEKMIRKSDM